MKFRTVIIWVTLLAISMAFLESAVVIYIREILYPDGFHFPLVTLDSNLAVTEIIREIATIVMLVAIGVISGRNSMERFALFIYSFAVWDIFYYIFLYLLIGWPENLLVWDVLFLIPVTWTGPVLSPLIVCLYMISLAVLILWFSQKGVRVRLTLWSWLLLISGSVTVVFAFAWDYSGFILEHYSIRELWNLPGPDDLFTLATHYIPERFNWFLFSLGGILILIPIIMLWVRMNHALYNIRGSTEESPGD